LRFCGLLFVGRELFGVFTCECGIEFFAVGFLLYELRLKGAEH